VSDKPIEIVGGTGNVFADLGYRNAAGEQLKALLASEIIKAMDATALTARAAAARTGVAATDFSRIRHVKLDRFTIDRLIAILERLDTVVEVQVSVHPQPVHHRHSAHAHSPLSASHTSTNSAPVSQ
jgi:predicted XRE-type DNA-binding protein